MANDVFATRQAPHRGRARWTKGAGKTTFYYAHLQTTGLRLVNADLLARKLNIGAYEAADLAASIRQELIRQRESFVFETVFFDPVGDKVAFLTEASAAGYTVLLCFIGMSSPEVSEERVAMRVNQGGHDVPSEKLVTRYRAALRGERVAGREAARERL